MDFILNTTQDHIYNSDAIVPIPENTPLSEINLGAPACHIFRGLTLAGGDIDTARFPRGFLRRRLRRFDHKSINMNNVLSIDPNLKDVSLPLLFERTETFGTEFIKSINSVKISNPPIPTSTNIEVIVNKDTSMMPSHVIGVVSRAPLEAGDPVRLFPAFSLVLTINCGNMPVFPPAYPVPRRHPGEQRVTLPLFYIVVPDRESFRALYGYLYSKNTQELIRALLPIHPPAMIEDDPNTIVPFATHLSETLPIRTLRKALGEVFGLWENVCALDISDNRLWTAMDLMWEILLTALAISFGRPELLICYGGDDCKC